MTLKTNSLTGCPQTVQSLRDFADRFVIRAAKLREEAEHFDKKAKQYLRHAKKLERDQ